jgi:hypothetical protein
MLTQPQAFLMALAFLCLTGSALSQTKAPDVVVKPYNGRPTVFINGKPEALPGYSPGTTKEFYDKYMALFYEKRMGVYLIWIDGWGGSATNRWWDGDEISHQLPPTTGASEYLPDDEPLLGDQVNHILKGDPAARLIIRFYAKAPKSWAELHPNEFAINEQGHAQDTPSLASDLFWERAAEFSAAVVRYCEAQPWADRVIGYNTHYLEEGTHVPTADGWLFDHNPLMTKKLRDFVRARYGDVEKLRTAWGDPSLTFENVQVPKDKLRGPVPEVSALLYWQNARDNQPLRDYLELTRDLFHLRFRQCAGAMAGAADRNVLILHDALKQVMQGWNLRGFFNYPAGGQGWSWYHAYPELMAGSGHMEAARLFDAKGFDGVLTPHDYQARGVGGVYLPEGMADSAVLRGKVYWGEMDTRSGTKDIAPARDYREWAAITWRNFATGWTRGFNSYWMYGFFIADWFGDKPVQDVIRRQTEVIRESIEWKRETVPGIAMIIDDTAALETNGDGNFLNEAVMWETKMGLARCGVPHNIYVLDDLALENFPKHRVYYFPNLFRVDDRRLELLKRKVFRDGAVVVWGPGSGISDGEKIGTASATRLTGFQFEMIPVNAQRRILISNFEHPITRNLPADMAIGGPLAYGPVIMPTNCFELGLAWAKGGNNHVGLGLKEFGKGAAQSPAGIAQRGEGDYAAVFTTAVNLPADLWRNLARYAGAHIYTKSNDVLLADNRVVALHSLKTERKRIALPGQFKVRDLIAGKSFSPGTNEIVFDLTGPDTRVFLLE